MDRRSGVALGLAATAVAGVLTLALQRKLPHKKMLIVTGVMIGVVLVTMVGGAMHTLQRVGRAPITSVRGREDLPYGLGVFPTWQGLHAIRSRPSPSDFCRGRRGRPGG